MFRSATMRLTLWYVAIVMAISLLCSGVLYNFATHELNQRLQHQTVRLRTQFGGFYVPAPGVAAEELTQGSRHIFDNLLAFNVVVIMVAGGASYALARRTLRPIEQAHQAQKRFTADASHELRTPLAAMKTEIEVALRGSDQRLEDLRHLLQSNLQEIDKLESLSTALLQLAQYEENDVEIVTQPCDLATVVDQALERVANIAKQRDISIHKTIQATQVLGDPVGLVELLVILLDNALKYSSAKSEVQVQIAVQAGHAEITVQDRGVGISEDALPHVFERFYRADHSRSKADIDGFGLGLSLAKLIVDRHHGTIRITSTLQKGTLVTVTLPVLKPAAG